LRGKYHRHGYAAASFGAPLSLNTFERENPGAAVDVLGPLLMERIGQEVPVLPVPLVARALIEADTPMSRETLEIAVDNMIRQIPEAHIHIPRDDQSYGVTVGVRNLLKRELIRETNGDLEIIPQEQEIVRFYANSIAHLFRSRSK
jgi:glycerol-3-phosphate O-acyltransferase